ncbi:hypothetical protein ACJRO7_018210 [Eucalyptus globulus]|uniref:HpcH/HpaI aldolase/citrate lyase domain-containing protein n=1 Tax=Eucalyptus globulus TaxID=34317 RepID=A0ABD3KSW1_EUCGL
MAAAPTTAAAAVVSPATNSSLSTLRNPKPPPFFSAPPSILPNRSPLRLAARFRALAPVRSSSSASASIPADLSPSSSSSPSSAADPRSLKSRLRGGETLYGIFLLSFSPTVAEIAGLAGYDFAVVDMEHGPGGVSEALHCLRALAGTGTPAILRLPESSAAWAKKALDLGPQGLMFPMIDTPELARDAVAYSRFPPAGVRGSAHTVVRASKYGIDEGYLGHCEEELLVMCQVESQQGVRNVEQIAAVDGVDCIQMGPLDLSASMGYLWDPGNKKVREMMRTAEKGVLGSGRAYLSGFAMPFDSPDDLRKRGYHMVSGAVDVGLFRNAVVEDVKRFRMGLEDQGGDSDGEMVDGKDADEKYWSE